MMVKKFLKNTTLGLAMILATTGIKFDIRPFRSNVEGPREEQSLLIGDGHGTQKKIIMPNKINTIVNFSIAAMLTRPQHFIITPSIHIYKFLQKAVQNLLLPPPNTPDALNPVEEEAIDVGVVDVDADENSLDRLLRDLDMSGRDFQDNARYIQGSVPLSDKVFQTSLKFLLKSHNCNLTTEQILSIVTEALYPSPLPNQTLQTAQPPTISSVTQQLLKQFRVYLPSRNLLAHLKTMGERLGLRQ